MTPTLSEDAQPNSDVDYELLSTTTTTFSRLSKFTLWVMEILRDGGTAATFEVAEQTMKSCRYINVYLNRLRKYGIARKHEGFWFLTSFGEYLTDVMCSGRDRDRDRYNTRITQQQHNNNTNITHKQPKVLKQVSIQSWLKEFSPDEIERVVVEVLIAHYNKTRGKFIYASSIYDLAERFDVNPGLLPDALMKLHEDQVIYKWPPHPRPGEHFKVGLKKDFIKKLEESQK